MRKRIAVIDGDSTLYATALGAEMKVGGSDHEAEGSWLQLKSLDQCYAEVLDKFEALVGDVDAEDAIIALTTFRCFRYELLPTYKANRIGTRRPAMLGPLQALIQERRPFGVLSVRGLEADDVCAISSGALQAAPMREPIIVSIDKDMLSVPGLSYSPMHPERGIVDVTETEADRAHLFQTLVGDAVDGYSGCPGVGPIKAAKVLDACAHEDLRGQWNWIVEQYRRKGLSEDIALVQARVARIVRAEEWNKAAGEIRLYGPGDTTPTVMRV